MRRPIAAPLVASNLVLVLACGGDPGSGASAASSGASGAGGGSGGGATAGTQGAGGGFGGGFATVGSGGGGTSTGTLMMGDAGGPGPGECHRCFNLMGNCTEVTNACFADPDCAAWGDCGGQCFTSDWSTACYEACNAAHPGSKALWTAVYDCACARCGVECDLQCAAAPPS